MADKGYVKFHRKIKDWGWYTDPYTFKLFFHLVTFANFADKEFFGETIKRGQIARSYSTLAKETGLSERNVRTALQHLQKTGEVTVERHSKFSVITIKNYNEYQESDTQVTPDRQRSDTRPTGDRQQDKNDKKDKKDKNDKKGGGETASLLTPEQYTALSSEFGEDKVKEYIIRVNSYCEEIGKPYKNPALIIRKWIIQDKGKENGKPKGANRFSNYTDTNEIDFKAHEEQVMKEMLEE